MAMGEDDFIANSRVNNIKIYISQASFFVLGGLLDTGCSPSVGDY